MTEGATMAFPTMYAITAQVSRVLPNGYTRTTSTPTFFLHADVQGITGTKGARRIAERMIRELAGEDAEVYVTTVDVTGDWIRPDDVPPSTRDGWLYDSGHATPREQSDRVRELIKARPDVELRWIKSPGGIFEVYIREATKRYSVRDQHGDELAAFDAYSHAAQHLRSWGGTGDVLDTEDDEVILTQETTDDED